MLLLNTVEHSTDQVEHVVGLYVQPWLAQRAAGTNAEVSRG